MAMAISHGRRTEERQLILGIEDPWIILGFVFLIGSTIACVIYGWLNWNKGEDD